MTRQTKPAGRRGKPPRLPPTALGTLPPAGSPSPEPAPPPRGRRGFVCFGSPKEGAGKSTLALNLALAWAGSQPRKVLIVHLDPLCRDDLSPQLGLEPQTLAGLAGFSPAALAAMAPTLGPLSQWGVGVLPQARDTASAASLGEDDVARVLVALFKHYDLFLDVEPCSPLCAMAYRMADLVFWTCLPLGSHLRASQAALHGLASLETVELVINQADMAGALASAELEAFLAGLGKAALTRMPCEPLLPKYANSGRVLVAEQPHSDRGGRRAFTLGALFGLP